MLAVGNGAVYSVYIFLLISVLYNNILNNCWLIYGLILNSSITLHTPLHCFSDVASYQILHRIYE
jgi:hypothetical protein